MQTLADARAVGRDIRQRQHLAAERIEHYGRAASRAALAHFRRQIIFGQRLDPRVERQHHSRTRLGSLERERTIEDRMAERVMIETQHHRLTADQPIVLQLEAGETLAIHPRQPHHRRGQGALRIEPFVLAERPHSVDPQRFGRLPLGGRQMAPQPNEGRSVMKLRFQLGRCDSECGGERRELLGRGGGQLRRPRIDRSRLGRERERLAVAIRERPARRRQRDLAGMLRARERSQTRPVEHHQRGESERD